MHVRLVAALMLVSLSIAVPGLVAGEAPLPEAWDYAPAMSKVAGRFRGRPGVVIHVGDSITHASPYSQWARAGKGQTDDDRAALAWMHAGADDDSDGWWLAQFDHPDGGRSYTACGGLRADELLAGGKRGLPSLETMLQRYRPQVVVLLIGTNDASAGRPLEAYRSDMEKATDQVLGHDAICILSTIPPHPHRGPLAAAYNLALRDLARRRTLPLIDYEREILTRRPDDWNGTLLNRNDVHPTARLEATSAGPTSEPTAENLRQSGYLLRGWLSVRKIAEVKRKVLDPQVPAGRDQAAARSETLRLPVTRDTWFSGVGSEQDANLGGAPRLKLKSHQEMSLVEVDTAPIRGRVVHGPAVEIQPALPLDGADAPRIETSFGRYRPVRSRSGPLPDPIVPLSFPVGEPIEGQTFSSLHCEVYVPHDAAAGHHRGKLTLRLGDQALVLDVSLRIWDFTLPDELSFLPEMNCYGLPAADERHFYRLAHRHRTYLNRVPYSQRGTVEEGCAPGWDGRRLDWTEFDRRFGPYLDGSAFADLPRNGVPIEGFYLPLHENWPTPIEASYNGDYWADRAFPTSYRQAFTEVTRQFAEHVHAKRWTGTILQCFLNGKNNFKERGWSRGSSPWLLDEPAHFQDFWALRYFALAFHDGIAQAPASGMLVFRADISRPQWQRNSLDGLLGYDVVSGAMRPYRRTVMDRKAANGEIVVEYGTANAVEQSNMRRSAGASIPAHSRAMAFCPGRRLAHPVHGTMPTRLHSSIRCPVAASRRRRSG